jgi:hypothetical protein
MDGVTKRHLLSTKPGEQHSATLEVIAALMLIDAVRVDDSKANLLVKDIATKYQKWISATGKAKAVTFAKFKRAIGAWNKFAARGSTLPFINKPQDNSETLTPATPTIGPIQTVLNQGIDTIMDEDANTEKSVPICIKGTRRHPVVCCVAQISTLEQMLKTYLTDPSKWNICDPFEQHSFAKYVKTSIRFLSLRCDKREADGSQCGSVIPLRTLWYLLPRDARIRLDKTDFGPLFRSGLGKHRVLYCPYDKCRGSKIGVVYSEIEEATEDDMSPAIIFCKECKFRHHVHAHQVTSQCCKMSFCRVCGQAPYHSTEVCRGVPSLELAPELLNKIKKCPSCDMPHEKTEGCDHMVCRFDHRLNGVAIGCGSHWCWRCMQILDTENPYQHTCLPTGLVAGEQDQAYHDIDMRQFDRIDAVPLDVQIPAMRHIAGNLDFDGDEIQDLHLDDDADAEQALEQQIRNEWLDILARNGLLERRN